MTYIIKILIWFVILGVVLGYSLYTGLIADLTINIQNYNDNFIAFLPPELVIIFSLIGLGLILGFVYAIKD